VLNFTLTGDTKFGGSSRWDLGSGSQISGAHHLTLDCSGAGYSEWSAPTIGGDVPGITLTNGNLGIKNMDASFQNPGTVLTISSNCQAVFWRWWMEWKLSRSWRRPGLSLGGAGRVQWQQYHFGGRR